MNGELKYRDRIREKDANGKGLCMYIFIDIYI